MEAIDSVREQTYANWEIILVDDASTDNSPVLYEQLAQDARIHIFYNEGNRGCGYTKRRCAELANGEICGFLDPDDTLEPNAIDIMVKEHISHQNVSMVYSRFYYADLYLNVLGVSEQQCVLPDGISFLEYGKGAISHFVSFKKAYYDMTPGIDSYYKRAVDHALYYLLEEVGKVYFIDKPLYYYRSNTGLNISTNTNADAAFVWHLLIMADACKRRGISIESLVHNEFCKYLDGERADAYIKGEEHIRSTKRYQIGKKVLLPLKWFR